jgi:ferritin-like metal-binding protein YciE
MAHDATSPIMDCAIIGALSAWSLMRWQRMHGEDVGGTLGNNQVADLLEETLNEEKEADLKLTEVAEQLYEKWGK